MTKGLVKFDSGKVSVLALGGWHQRRAAILVLDSLGVGALPDAENYGDEGANTLGHTAAFVGGLELPNLARLGIGNLTAVAGVPPIPAAAAAGAFGRMAERSAGKDTMTGHWEMMGVITSVPMRTFPNGFPPELIEKFEQAIGRKVLGNKVASGTVIIEELGPEHMRTGRPIVYTSADSVFQIACHEDIVPVEELYRMCRIARELLVGEWAVGRVIARPFTGQPGSFVRTPRRHDFAMLPPQPTLLERLHHAGVPVTAVGKIQDIFSGRGITSHVPTRNNDEGIQAVTALLAGGTTGLIFANLVDFDMLYGHRNDPRGYAAALEAFDRAIPAMLAALRPGDLLFITGDHGCDPTTPSTDHSREYVPVLVAGPGVRGHDLGTRSTFADLGATVAEMFGVAAGGAGESFLSALYSST